MREPYPQIFKNILMWSHDGISAQYGDIWLKGYGLVTSSWRGRPLPTERALWGCTLELWSFPLLWVTRKATLCSKMGLSLVPHTIRKPLLEQGLSLSPSHVLNLSCPEVQVPISTEYWLRARWSISHTTSSMKYHSKPSILVGQILQP